jgi:hypothetical protein
MHTRFALPALLLLTAAAAGPAAEPAPLTAAEVRALLTGNTLDGETRLARFRSSEVRSFQVHLRADGTLTLRNFEGNTDEGVWEVTDGGLFCNQYRHTRRGMHRCYSVQQEGDAYLLIDTESGSASTVFTVRAGNPEGL